MDTLKAFANTSNKINRAKNAIGLPIFFIVLAVVLFVLGSFLKQTDAKKATFDKTEATITKVETWTETDADNNTETVGETTFEYTVDGEKYESKMSYTNGDEEGNKFEIFYNPEDPTETISGDTSIGGYFIIGGCVSVAIAVISVVVVFLRRRKIFGI